MALATVTALAGLAGALAQFVGGCQQAPVQVPVRSLERSGQVSFVCLNPPGSAQVEVPLADCTAQQFTSTCQYYYEDDAGDIDAGVASPHLYALVTQTTRGEVAVVDTSALTGSVLDQNPREPGSEFIHVGANPTGIVSSPGSIATFVGVAELGHEGLFALPSDQIRPASAFGDPATNPGDPDLCFGMGGQGPNIPALYNQPVLGLTAWPACHLPSPPGDMIIVDDPADNDGQQRLSCLDGNNYVTPSVSDRLVQEGHGRPKLVIAMPDLGGIVVVDAQTLLNQAPGSFADCPIERWLPLKEPTATTLAQLGAQPAPYPETGNACGNPPPNTPALATSYTPHPGSISYSGGRLYVADTGAPVIHVIDMFSTLPDGTPSISPCNPIERPPLLPTSAENPARVVFANKVSVATLPTPDLTPPSSLLGDYGKSDINLRTFLYATDYYDGSVMVFDVSDSSTTRRPLVRKHPEYNPFQPRDRVKYAAPAADVVLVQRDVPRIDPVTGVAKNGVLCNPDPNALTCIASSSSCDIGTSYRTSVDYTSGAGPAVLRGEFAFAALTNGHLAVIDVADFDAPCRTPISPSTLAGCKGNSGVQIDSAADVSCNTVEPFAPRSADFLAVGVDPGNHVPGILTFPVLYNADGSVFGNGAGTGTPQMFATLPASVPSTCRQSCDPNLCGSTCDTLPGCPLQLFVGGVQTPVNLDQNGNACTGTHCVRNSDCPVPHCDHTQKPPVCPNGNTCKSDTDCGPACDTETGTCSAGPPCTGTSCYEPGGVGPNSGASNSLLMNLEDPRGQVVDQNWTVTYEGAIPAFAGRQACLYVAGSPLTCNTNPGDAGPSIAPPPVLKPPVQGTLNDPNSRFCDSGVLSENAFSSMLAAEGNKTLSARDLADYVQVTSDMPGPTDPYWSEAVALDGGIYQPSCSYTECLSLFGTIEQTELSTNRDLRVIEAYQDHVELEMRNAAPIACTPDGSAFVPGTPCCGGATIPAMDFDAGPGGVDGGSTGLVCTGCAGSPDGCPGKNVRCDNTGACTRAVSMADIKCCFPGELSFTVRGGSQWMVMGDQSGFIHHVIADESSNGACRNSCDPAATRKNGRVLESLPLTEAVRCSVDKDCPQDLFCVRSPGASGVCAMKDRSPTEADPSPRFMNPMFRFAVTKGTTCQSPSDCNLPGDGCNAGVCNAKVYTGDTCDPMGATPTVCPSGTLCDCDLSLVAGNQTGCSPGKCYTFSNTPVAAITPRDSVFRFSTNNSFSPLLIPLTTDPTALISPQRATYLPSTSEVVVTDGSINGIIFVSLQSSAVSRSYF